MAPAKIFSATSAPAPIIGVQPPTRTFVLKRDDNKSSLSNQELK